MISYITGTVHTIFEQSVICMTNGIGVELLIAQPQRYSVGQNINCHVYTHWNQENGFTLYGFEQLSEKTIFTVIIDVPGIGPKLALTALAHLGAAGLVRALQHQEADTLSSVPGIGKKKAELVVLHTHEKVGKLIDKGIFTLHDNDNTFQQLSQVLGSLHYSRQEIQQALEFVRTHGSEKTAPASFDHLLRKALSFLSQQRA